MKQFERFRLDTANQCLLRDGVAVALAPRPFAVLRYLVENPDRLIPHDELMDALWPETYVQPQVLRTYMLELRKVLGDDAGQPRFIQTLPKRGYRFVAAVVEGGEGKQQGTVKAAAKAVVTTAAASVAVRDAGIVGRDGELQELRAQFELLERGERRVVFVAGEAGIGKTALVDAFCREIEEREEARVGRGQCVQGVGGTEEYYPVAEALSRLCAGRDGETACRTLWKMAPAWLAAGREGDGVRGAARERTVGELCGALEELTADKPLVLLFEDLDWADEGTLNLISALARRRAPARLMVLATFRPRKHGAGHSLKVLKQDLLMRRLCKEIALLPLARGAVSELLGRELHGKLALVAMPALAGFVYQRSEGNPLFVIAILEHLIAQRVLVRRNGSGTGDWELCGPFPDCTEVEGGVPESLAQMIEAEVERLSPEEQKILEAGSLLTVAFPAWAVSAALEMDAGEAEEACDALARKLYFLERAGQDELPDGTRSAFYVFAHGLFREVLYQRQAATRRAKRQVRIAERLGQLFAGREACVGREMAMHFEAAGEWGRAVNALRGAAGRAAERRACGDAVELLERALRLVGYMAGSEGEAVKRSVETELEAERNRLLEPAELTGNFSTKA